MAELDDKVIVTKSKITDIADALREEMSESYEYSLPTMVEKAHELGQGQGSVYTAGVGIDITNRVVSVVDTLMIRGSANGSVASIVDGADDIPLKSCMVYIEPVQSGSGDPSPSNVRPITGWTECNLSKTGKNIFGGDVLADTIVAKVQSAIKDTVNKTITYTAQNINNKVIFDKFKENTRYTFKFFTQNNSLTNLAISYTDGTSESISKDTLTVSANGKSISSLMGFWATGTTILNYEEVGIFEGVITTQDFVSYTGQTYNIEFPSQAGTVYGGTLDVTNGVLTVTDGYIASYNSETLPSTWISSMDVYAEGTTPTTGAEVVYKLATPQTYNVTPTEIKTLLGINNIFADCGDVDVEYTRDATLIINKLLELVSGNNRAMMKSAVVEKTDEVKEQKKDSVEENLDA